MSFPKFCRPEAFTFFTEQLLHLETTLGLVLATTAVAMHATDDLEPHSAEQQIAEIASRVRGRVKGNNPQAFLAQLHHTLFDELGFSGDTADYYNPINSYLPCVLHRKLGIPILLCLVYKAVGEGVGLEIQGVNAPLHFLARVMDTAGPRGTLVDPFNRGAIYTHDEALRFLAERGVSPEEVGFSLQQSATNREWLERILRNLDAYFVRAGFQHDREAMREFLTALHAYFSPKG